MGTEVSEDNFKDYFETMGMDIYTALNNVFISEDDVPRGKDMKNALVISMTELPPRQASNSIWQNNEMYMFELYHLEKQSIKRIRELLQIYPGTQPASVDQDNFDDGDISDWSISGGGSKSAETSPVYAGSHSMKVTSGIGQDTFVEKPLSIQNPTTFQVAIQAPTLTIARMFGISTATADVFLFRIGSNNLTIMRGNGPGAWTTYTLITGISVNTWYFCEARNIDWSGMTADIYVNNELIQQISLNISTPTKFKTWVTDGAYTLYIDSVKSGMPPFINLDRFEKLKFEFIQYLNRRFNGMHKWRIVITIDKLEEVTI